MKWFFVYLIPGRIGIFGKCSFFTTGEIRSTRRKTSQSEGENQQKTQTPTYGVNAGNGIRATLVEGECSHHCAIFAPQNYQANLSPHPKS